MRVRRFKGSRFPLHDFASAARTVSTNNSSSSRLRKYPSAPADIACSITPTSSGAVMKMTGSPLPARDPCTSVHSGLASEHRESRASRRVRLLNIRCAMNRAHAKGVPTTEWYVLKRPRQNRLGPKRAPHTAGAPIAGFRRGAYFVATGSTETASASVYTTSTWSPFLMFATRPFTVSFAKVRLHQIKDLDGKSSSIAKEDVYLLKDHGCRTAHGSVCWYSIICDRNCYADT